MQMTLKINLNTFVQKYNMVCLIKLRISIIKATFIHIHK
jgi:hypothetical protein